MELAYLGLFSKVFNWVLDKIFEPIFKWLTGLLNTVLTWVFEKIFAPILLPILEDALEFFIELYLDIYSTFIYSLFSGVLRIIDYIETAFDVFIGLKNVKYYPNPSNKAQFVEGSLVEVLLQQDTVSTIFWLLTAAGLAIALMLTIFATAKSSFDLDFENKRPVSKVLTAMMKTFIQFFSVPFLVYFMLRLSTEILRIAATAISGDTRTTLGRIVFIVASMNAANGSYSSYNASANPGITLGTSPADKARYPFYIVDAQNGVQPKDYVDLKAVTKVFDLSNFDYLIGFLAAIFLLFVMAICLITFVQRLFEIVLLYIVSPYFVSTMPLDDGERFGRWRDMFIGKCFTGFGSAIGMRLYLMVCQLIMGNTIRFSESSIGSSIEMDYIMKLFFLIGGAWAVFKSGPMITELISAGAGQHETMTQSVAGGALYGHTIGKAMSFGKGTLMKGLNKGAGALASKSRRAKHADPNQKFEGSKSDAKWKKGTVSPNAQRGKVQIGAHRAKAAAAKTPQIKPGRLAMSKDANMMAAAKAATAAVGTSKVIPGKEKKNFRLGRMVQSTYDANGNHKIRVMGFGVDRDASGNTMAFQMRIGGLKVQRTDSNQSMKLARMHIPGITRIESNVQNGQLKYSDISVLHGAVRYRNNESGSQVRVLGGLTNVQHGQQGTDVRVMGGLTRVHHGADGTHVRVAGGLTDVQHSQQGGTNVNVMGGLTRVHHGDDGTRVRVAGGLTQVDHGVQGTHVGVIGDHVLSVRTNSENLQSVKIGVLEYSRSGITKETPQQPKPQEITSKKPESETKPGGK